MEARLDYMKALPEAFKAMVQMEGVVRRSGIDPKLLELIEIRASQLNGCAFWIDMPRKTRVSKASPSSESTRSTHGAKPLSTPRRNEQRRLDRSTYKYPDRPRAPMRYMPSCVRFERRKS